MNKVKIVDVTLRDGGCVNNFNFGQVYMQKILEAQEAASIDVIELGYLDDKEGSISGRTQYINEQVIPQCLLNSKKLGITYLSMIDYGKYNIDNLQECSECGIDGIRLAFHKKNYLDIVPLGKKILEKGYQLYMQPMLTLHYSDDELLQLINLVNCELSNASGFYIVDSFGEMYQNDVNRLFKLIDQNLISDIAIGFHCHNNLQLAFSNAITFLNSITTREILLDSSIMGMGKGAGNLNTELILEYLNLYYGKHYVVDPLLKLIDKVINPLYQKFHWGYAIEYYLSSINRCSPSYAGYFYNECMLPIEQVRELLGMLAEERKYSFHREYAEQIYRQYTKNRKIGEG